MSARQKSQKGFVAVTLITLLALALVIIVYATLLGTFPGGQVQVVTVNGDLKYSTTNSTTPSNWTLTLNNIANGTSWYVMFNTTSGGYIGYVNITWQLQNYTGGLWQNVAGAVVNTDNFYLNGSVGQEIYASTDGTQTENYDWGTNKTKQAGNYRIEMTMITA